MKSIGVSATGIALIVLFASSTRAQMDAIQASSGKRAAAEAFPTKPIRLIVPAAAGGGSDILSRILGQKITESFRQQVVVDTRAGAGNIIGTNIAAKSPPDGHTLLMVATTHAINVSLVSKLPYNSVRDFTAVTLCASAPYLLVVNPSLPVKSVKELIALAKAKPGQLNYGQGGNGTPPHLAAELFKSMAKLNIAGIPYNGGGLAIAATLAGEVHMTFGVIPAAVPFVKAGKLTGLGVSSLERSGLIPELPTIAEAGIPGYEAIAWYGILAPARTDAAIVNKLDQVIKRILQIAEVKERLAGLGFEPIPTTPEKFAAYIESEIPKWARVVKDANVHLD